MPDETPDTVKEYDEQRLTKYSARGKKWNNYSLVFFGCAVVWLLLLQYTDMESIIGPVGSLLILMFIMLLAIFSLTVSTYYTWRARTLRKEIKYYSTDSEPEDTGQTEILE